MRRLFNHRFFARERRRYLPAFLRPSHLRYRTGTLILVLSLLLLGLMYLMSTATRDSAWFGSFYSLLLVLNTLVLLGLGALIALNISRLVFQVRQRRPGAKLTVRLMILFVVLSIAPVGVVYYFSLEFLHRSIDSWFNVDVESSLANALELSRTSLGLRRRELLAQTERLALDVAGLDDDQIIPALDDARRLSGAAEISLIGARGQIIGTSSIDPGAAIQPNRPNDAVIAQARQSGDYIGLDTIADKGLHARVVVLVDWRAAAGGTRFDGRVAASEDRLLQALFPVTERMNDLADSVETSFARYRTLDYLRKQLKLSFTLTLSIILLMILFMAVYAALHSARRVVAPLRDLSKGTKAVAGGDYDTQLPGTTDDEIGFLVASFNEMTRALKQARDDNRASQQQVEAQRAYLATVLRRLSAGVLALDSGHRITTANHAAEEILDIDLDFRSGVVLDTLATTRPALEPLVRAIQDRIGSSMKAMPARDWRVQVEVDTPRGRRSLMCSAAPLAGGEGHVIVLDDVTELMQAQRNAAWSEVARRLAHEIKNPLTPIRLSAERLRLKYLPTVKGAEAEQMDRLTRTIVQQVDSLQAMINAFSDYARPPAMRRTRVDLKSLVLDIVELYRAATPSIRFETRLEPSPMTIRADPDRLRQLLHNLLKNAVEACADSTANTNSGEDRSRIAGDADDSGDAGAPPKPPPKPKEGEVVIGTRSDLEGGKLLLSVQDNGPGFPEELTTTAFEPYITSKSRGSGLGLAIVKKIVEEHTGEISVRNLERGGALVEIVLPQNSDPDPSNGALGSDTGESSKPPGAKS
ncbi:MAG: HAMP domain-containing protein [Ectothiorhodospiraceae bacterium AqS1]|nr:HAMP domain-containing protein [Ectothiorhodospiraceae bacterium AqS1]